MNTNCGMETCEFIQGCDIDLDKEKLEKMAKDLLERAIDLNLTVRDLPWDCKYVKDP